MTADNEAAPRRKYNSTRRRRNAEQTRLTLQKLLSDPSDQDIEGMQALHSSDLYILLTEIRGWTREQYINWIVEISLAAFAAKGVVQ